MTILNKEKIIEVARTFIEEGKFDKAIREYEKLLLADPSDLRVKLRIAELYTKRKQVTEAIRIYREVAEAYSVEGFYLKAVTVYKNVIRLNPSLIEINEQLASLYERMGLISDAIRQYDIYASALDLRGMIDRVIDIRQKIVQLNPKDGNARVKLAELYQREGKMEEAIDQYQAYASQLEESGGDRTKLVDLFEKIITYRPGQHEMLRNLIRFCMELEDSKRALKWLEYGKELVERDPALLALTARIYASQNQNETARTKYMLLADLLIEAGDIDAALDTYTEIIALLPDEEERLARRIEELKPGALAVISEKAQQRRQELEQAEIERQEAEEEAKEEERSKASAAKEGVSKTSAPSQGSKGPPAPSKGTEGGDKGDAAAVAVPPKAPAALPQPMPMRTVPDRRAADAAFDLGHAYRQMGLVEEARTEFAKAREIYAACQEGGITDADVVQRLSLIEAEFSGAVAERQGETAASEVTRPRPTPSPEQTSKKKPVSGRASSEHAVEVEVGEKKKKVSFV